VKKSRTKKFLVKKITEGAVDLFGDTNLARKYRGDRVELWLRGAITTGLMEDFLDQKLNGVNK